MADIVDIKPKSMAPANDQQDDRAVIMATLENMMVIQEHQERGMKLMTAAFSQLQAHVRDLEHEVANLKKNKKPAIYNATGARAN